MDNRIIAITVSLLFGCNSVADVKADIFVTNMGPQYSTVISKNNWIHGAADCNSNTDPEIDVYKHNHDTIIIRQNKCLTYEAPFIYVLIGKNKVLILDTGAIKSDDGFSLYTSLKETIGKKLGDKEILVLHSHGHSDHFQGDSSFTNQPNVTLISPKKADVHRFFGFKNWPLELKEIELGGRNLTIIPTPGHQEESITIYDHQTKWLLTGDTLYPGNIYIKDWQAYRDSVKRLAEFSKVHEIEAIFGSHIEMKNKPGQYYPIGSTYQPDEVSLDMSTESLHALNAELRKTPKPSVLVFDGFIIQPMGVLQNTLSNIVRWFTQ